MTLVGISHDENHVYTVNYPPAEPYTLPSITTAMKSLVQPWMGPWAKGLTATAAVGNLKMLTQMVNDAGEGPAIEYLKKITDHKRDKAADRGTRVHEIADALAHGVEVAVPDDIATYVDAYLRFVAERAPRYTASEYLVWHSGHGYAGTGDLVAWIHCPIDNRECRYRLDIKTMELDAKGKPKGPYEVTALQLAAAEYAQFCGRPDDPKMYAVPKAEHCGVLALSVDGQYRVVPYTVTPRTFRAFLAALEAWNWLQSEAKTTVGQPLVLPPTLEEAKAA